MLTNKVPRIKGLLYILHWGGEGERGRGGGEKEGERGRDGERGGKR